MKIAVIGTGYVGLVSGTCFSEFGHHVTCVDTNADKIRALQANRIPIYEPGLEDMVRTNSERGTLQFTTELADAVAEADAVFIAVGTPSRRGDGHADLQYVFQAVDSLIPHIRKFTLVVTKSTVPVGTGQRIYDRMAEKLDSRLFDVASNPEFLREGAAIEDFMRPDRVVVGAESDRAQAIMRELYRPLYLNETPVLFTNRETAEVIKYAANAFLATKISFMNEMADLCEHVGADVQQVAKGIGLDNRIGAKFLHAGPGFGGSCFPKDTRALVSTADDAGVALNIVRSVVAVNEARKKGMAQRVIAALGNAGGKHVAILGLTFKPNTDDVRESPALDIIAALQEAGADIHAYDPQGMKEGAALLPDITCHSDAYGAMDGADATVIITEWNEFRALDLHRVKTLMADPLIIDLRNIYAGTDMAALGFRYIGVGKPATHFNR